MKTFLVWCPAFTRSERLSAIHFAAPKPANFTHLQKILSLNYLRPAYRESENFLAHHNPVSLSNLQNSPNSCPLVSVGGFSLLRLISHWSEIFHRIFSKKPRHFAYFAKFRLIGFRMWRALWGAHPSRV